MPQYDVIISRGARRGGQRVASIIGVQDADITLIDGEDEDDARIAVVAYLRHHRLPRPHTVNFL